MDLILKEIAHMEAPYDEKFGVPRQSHLCDSVKSRIVFKKEYSDRNAFRYLDTYSHLWLIWGFSENFEKEWSPTVRPPKSGGNKRAGVFATRSPFRPNPLGLSCVKMESIEYSGNQVKIVVSGADLVNNTPIYDVKPYVPYADCVGEALRGISSDYQECLVEVEFQCAVEDELKAQLVQVLGQDPHPMYKNEKGRVYKMSFASKTVSFTAYNNKITVLDIV